MKKVYFIRHAESEGNVSHTWQSHLGGLTERGKQQAQAVAARLADVPFDHILSSTMERAVETAAAIAAARKNRVEYSDVFRERRRPTEFIGLPRNDPGSLESEATILGHFGELGWRYSDEENFEDLKTRALEALAYAVHFEGERICVLTHGFFMRIVLAAATFGNALTGEQCARFMPMYHMANTGISVFNHNHMREEDPWWVWTWNDHTHLDALSPHPHAHLMK